ncbi:MAG TPA: DUF4129 domain-containing protein [Bryobacteraceae bacterium]|nr:DUF4129 domain-containing protein [Bryobacteraceae bacterium]
MSGAELLEQAVQLCRSNRNGAMAAYWTGTAPLLAAVLYFCQSATHRANAEELVAPASLVLTLLWVWMNFWHTIYCDALWRSVSDEGGEDWSLRLGLRIALTNAALQGTGLLVLVFAILPVLSFPWAYAFYQNCHVYAARFDMRDTARRASRQASLWPRQKWQLLSCGSLLAVFVFVNVLLTFVAGAQLLNSIFGIQTALVQSSMAIFSLPYFAAAGCITFLVIDPLWKAAHVIRCFHGEAQRDGSDLRLVLRRAAVLALLMALSGGGEALRAQTIPAPKYERAIKEVLQRPEYEWSARQARPESGDSALRGYFDATGRWLALQVKAAVEWLQQFIREPETPPGTVPSGTGLRVAVIAVVALCLVAMVLLVVRSRRRAKAAIGVAESVPAAVAVDLSDDSVTPDQLPTNEWLQMADEFLRGGNTRLAARAVYLAALSQLDGEKLITLGRHKTNLEYQRELARRARSAPHVSSGFRAIADVFERSWYGQHSVEQERVMELKGSLGSLRANA